MKRVIPYIVFPLAFALIGAIIIESVINAFAFILTPFPAPGDTKLLLICCLIFVISISLMIAVVFFYARYILNLDDMCKLKKAIIIQALTCIVLLIAFWSLFDIILHSLF